MNMVNIIEKTKKAHKLSQARKSITACLALLLLISFLSIPIAYAAGESQVTLTITQIISSRYASEPREQAFIYRLTPEDVGNPMPTGSGTDNYVFVITGNGTKQVGPITFNSAGTYIYTLNCVTDTADYAKDRQVYTIYIRVAPSMIAYVTVYKDSELTEKATSIEFEHVFQGFLPSDPDAMIDPIVNKTVSGNPPAPTTFTFKLVAENPLYPMPEGSSDGVKIIKITGPGQGMFGNWPYYVEGIYRYTVSEVNTGASGYTFDTAVYTITDTVEPVNGQLELTRVVTNSASKQVTSMSFINKYSSGNKPAPTPTPTPAPPSPTPTPVPEPTPGPDPELTPTPTPEPTDTPKRPGNPGRPPSNPGNNLVPDEDGGFIEIDPDGTPTGEWRYEDDGWVYYEYPPPASSPGTPVFGPKTGDESQTVLHTILLCISGTSTLGSASYLIITGRRRK